jgi:hypothetical protein
MKDMQENRQSHAQRIAGRHAGKAGRVTLNGSLIDMHKKLPGLESERKHKEHVLVLQPELFVVMIAGLCGFPSRLLAMV